MHTKIAAKMAALHTAATSAAAARIATERGFLDGLSDGLEACHEQGSEVAHVRHLSLPPLARERHLQLPSNPPRHQCQDNHRLAIGPTRGRPHDSRRNYLRRDRDAQIAVLDYCRLARRKMKSLMYRTDAKTRRILRNIVFHAF